MNLFGQNNSQSGLSFLKNGFGARNIAMGDFGAAGANDLSALNYNPALLTLVNKTQLSFSNNKYFDDLSSKQFAGSINAFGLSFAVGLNTTSVTGIEVRTKPGEAESTFDANYFSAGLSAAYSISNSIKIGASAKYLYESLFSSDASGMAFDLGIALSNLFDGFTVGASVRNMGSMNNLKDEPSKLPTDILAGALYNFKLEAFNLDVSANAGIQKYNGEDSAQLHSGAEFLYSNTVAVRFGYMSGFEAKSFTTGFGLKWNKLNIDYAYVPIKYALGDSHIISLIYSFD